jgi:hypothetical protein
MPINVQACTNAPTTVSLGNFNGGAFRPVVNGIHRMYTALNCRVTLTPRLNTGVGIGGITSLDPQAAAGGDTIFLPFFTNEICSTVLPTPAAATAAGIDSFLTTNMSGCKVYVDRVVGAAGSIVVYHANNEANAPPGNLGGRQPNLELPICAATLDASYNTARGHYALAPHNLNLVPAANVSKPVYYAGGMAAINRKVGQKRLNVEFTGGTMVFGVVNAGAWNLYWSTYGSTEYDRPWNAPKGWFKGKHRNPTQSSNPDYKVVGFARFFP